VIAPERSGPGAFVVLLALVSSRAFAVLVVVPSSSPPRAERLTSFLRRCRVYRGSECGKGLALPTGENEPPPDQRLPPRKTRTPLRRTAARTPELHRQSNAMEIERSHLTLETLPTNADQDLPTPSGPTDLKKLSHTFFLRELLQGGRAAWQRWTRKRTRDARQPEGVVF